MPTAGEIAGFRFFFFSNEHGELALMHVEQAERYAKFWLADLSLAFSRGFRTGELAELRRLVFEHRFRRSEMSTAAVRVEPLAVDVSCTDVALRVVLADGREIVSPLECFPRLQDAAPSQSAHWRTIGGGVGIHWPDLDEDISVAGLLATR
jgi:hypothetical protein